MLMTGARAAKNVILAGVKSVGLLDSNKAEIADLGANVSARAASACPLSPCIAAGALPPYAASDSCTMMSVQFYLTEKDVGKERAASSIDQFVGLNKYVNVHLAKEQLSEKLVQNYNVSQSMSLDITPGSLMRVRCGCVPCRLLC